MVVDLKANEIVKKAGDVQHCCNGSDVKGKLIVTNQRIYFITLTEEHKEFNLEIMPDKIRELNYFKTNIIFPNGLSIIMKEGEELRFIVKKRDSWSTLINKMY